MTIARLTVLSVTLLGTALAASGQRRDDYCAAQPPPQGLVERCRSRTMIVPDTLIEFRFFLASWMSTCVSSERAPMLVHDNDSVDTLWKLVEGLPGHSRAVRVIPTYEPLTFTQAGKTCYGVKSVEFDVQRQRGAVDVSGQFDITSGPTDEMIKSAATAAKRALGASPSSVELKKFLGVLDGLERYGADFDDTYYPIAPVRNGTWEPFACFKEYHAGRYDCLSGDAALKACTRHLATDLVQSHAFDKLNPREFAEVLEIKANEIHRGFSYLLPVQDGEMAAGYCPAVKGPIKARVSSSAARGRTALYSYY